ncbi:MAG: hypothetical protein MZV49_26305 [Rhodopseudomonas palustris]|nr:hypothetical protein [Rhodopseudomonas palustris]
MNLSALEPATLNSLEPEAALHGRLGGEWPQDRPRQREPHGLHRHVQRRHRGRRHARRSGRRPLRRHRHVDGAAAGRDRLLVGRQGLADRLGDRPVRAVAPVCHRGARACPPSVPRYPGGMEPG